MKRPAIKICGLSSEDTIDHVIRRGASHVGFIFFEKSPRHVEPDVAAGLIAHVRGRAKTVAVSVDADNELLEEIVYAARPDMLQLHGHETPDRVMTIKALFGLPVIKAFSLRAPEDLARVDDYDGVADHLLFDAKPPANATLPGGNGVTFDWRLLAGWRPTIPYFLSGGLSAENVAAALHETGAHGLDVSSGVESAPGVKDAARIDAFFDAVDAAYATA
ncbi:phosphoribosylanthranilate isomerase [Martelella mediterranea]|uniref:N-(5'-phosphoribosyl)anthranilate isomerase n=1 Tax=Martelella mediterranea DSM 17316 TaxID=1122214 RepID=A0A1U9YXB0_9HYPH|nr:phosphoribosylanthranilate isomerase [Martelella mediterranea]AQZ50083.1 N-(5'-phosphoribosyl)anthranilate isomerase [Martelella mediterranea DSM 17316]